MPRFSDPIMPSSHREVMLFEQAYSQGCDDTFLAMNEHFERELWRARHPILNWFYQVRLKLVVTWLRYRTPTETEDVRG